MLILSLQVTKSPSLRVSELTLVETYQLHQWKINKV